MDDLPSALQAGPHSISSQLQRSSELFKRDLLQCKHQLAARIGDLLGKCEYREVPDHTLSNMLMS